MATICLAPAGNARSPQGRSGSNGRAQSLEIPLLSRRLGAPVYDAGRKTWRGPGGTRTQLSGASARTVQSNEARTDIDVDVVHVVVRHDAARVVVGDQPSDDLGLFAPYAEIDRLAGSMLRRCSGTGDDSAGTAGRDDFDVAEVVADPAKQVAGGRRQTRCGGTGGAAGMSVAGPRVT